jgi:two-component system chemotaxis response regulator CheB
VLVVDASPMFGGALAALLKEDPALDVVGWAADEAGAARMAARLKPDVILIDLHLPGSDPVRTTQRLMQETPTPIVALTEPAGRADTDRSVAVLAAGALAVVARPASGAAGPAMGAKLRRTLKTMAQVRVVRRRTAAHSPAALPARVPLRDASLAPLPEVVAIGASTGGPQALQEILTRLPAAFAPPVLVVQHIAPTFAEGLVDWLRPQCALPLALARHGTELRGPGIHVAPTGHHMVVRGHTLVLTDDPPVRGHRPSATVLFSSVALAYGARAVGVLLSGMGDDGAAGLRELKQAGGTTIAQDEASSVVFGMPAAAIALGIVDHVRPPREIGPLLVELVRRNAGG